MNSEKRLYDYIKSNGGFLAARDKELAQALPVRIGNIPRYKQRLRNAGFIETKVQFMDSKPITMYRIIKDYTGQLTW